MNSLKIKKEFTNLVGFRGKVLQSKNSHLAGDIFQDVDVLEKESKVLVDKRSNNLNVLLFRGRIKLLNKNISSVGIAIDEKFKNDNEIPSYVESNFKEKYLKFMTHHMSIDKAIRFYNYTSGSVMSSIKQDIEMLKYFREFGFKEEIDNLLNYDILRNYDVNDNKIKEFLETFIDKYSKETMFLVTLKDIFYKNVPYEKLRLFKTHMKGFRRHMWLPVRIYHKKIKDISYDDVYNSNGLVVYIKGSKMHFDWYMSLLSICMAHMDNSKIKTSSYSLCSGVEETEDSIIITISDDMLYESNRIKIINSILIAAWTLKNNIKEDFPF